MTGIRCLSYFGLKREDFPSNRILLFLVAYSLFLSFESWFLGPYSYIPLHDTGDGQLPGFYTVVQQFAKFGFTLWNPLQLGGVDEAATYNLVHFQTPFYVLLPMWLAFAVILFLQHLLGALAMYVLCKKQFQFDERFSLIAGLAYTSPFVFPFAYDPNFQWSWNNYFEYRLCWGFFVPIFPWFCLAIDQLAGFRSFARAIFYAGILGAFISLTMFFVAFYPYMIVALFLAVLTLGKQTLWKRVALFVPVGIGSLVFQLQAIKAAGRLYPLSHRTILDGMREVSALPSATYAEFFRRAYEHLSANILYRTLVIKPLDWFYFIHPQPFKPQLYLASAAFVMFAIFYKTRKELKPDLVLQFKMWLAMYIMFLAIGFQDILSVIVPLLPKSGLLSRLDGNYLWGLILKFGIVLLWVNTFRMLCKVKLNFSWWQHRARSLAITGIALMGVLIPAWIYRQENISYLLLHGSVRANYFSEQMKTLKNRTREDSPFRVISSDQGLEPNYPNPLGFETFDGHENIFSRRISEYFIEMIRPQLKDYFDRMVGPHLPITYEEWKPFLGNKAYVGIRNDKAGDNFNLGLMALANVRYFISTVPVVDDRLKRVSFTEAELGPRPSWVSEPLKVFKWLSLHWPTKFIFGSSFRHYFLNLDLYLPNIYGRNLFIYELVDVVPRAYLSSKFRVVEEASRLAMLRTETLDQLRESVILDWDPGFAVSDKCGSLVEEPRIFSSHPERVEIEVQSACAQLLIVTQAYSPFWKATVNGQPAKVIPAYHAFDAIPVPAGPVKVVLTYDFPRLFAGRGTDVRD